MHKQALRNLLYIEQHHLCVFCEQEIQESNSPPRIDHWRPLEHNPQDAFNWDNLHLSCTTPDTCDIRKNHAPLKWLATDPDLPWPIQFAYENVLGFTSGGRVYVRNDVALNTATRRAIELAIEDQHEGERTRRSILNLNAPALREARAAAIDDEQESISSEFGGQSPTPQHRHDRALALLTEARRPAFVSIRVASLMDALGRGR